MSPQVPYAVRPLSPGLQVLVVDDEPLARQRLRTLLGDCSAPGVERVAEAEDAVSAMAQLSRAPFDLVLLDIHMPGLDGLGLAAHLRGLQPAPAVVFVTAHAEHAVQAFELSVQDYLTKPVRLELLQEALRKADLYLQQHRRQDGDLASKSVLVQERGRAERIPLQDVLYFKAELKYLTVRTPLREHILEGSLNELEERFGEQFLRVHRNALVARRAMRALERHAGPGPGDEGETWTLQLHGVDDVLQVSRRQLASVRAVLAERS